MSTQTHTCEKSGCFYCQEMLRINTPRPHQIAQMIQATLGQLYEISRLKVNSNSYMPEEDTFIMNNLHLSNRELAERVGRTKAGVAMRKVYLRRLAA